MYLSTSRGAHHGWQQRFLEKVKLLRQTPAGVKSFGFSTYAEDLHRRQVSLNAPCAQGETGSQQERNQSSSI